MVPFSSGSEGWTQEVDEGSGWPYWYNADTMDFSLIPPEWVATGSTNEDLAMQSPDSLVIDPYSTPPDEAQAIIMEADQFSGRLDNNGTRLNNQANDMNGELVLVQESTSAILTETRVGRVQADATRIVAGVAGGTAGFFVATGVTLFGGGPVAGVVAGTAIAKTVEKVVESGINWLRRKAIRLYRATQRAWNGKLQLSILQREFHEACRTYRRDNSHDEALRISSSLKEDYCSRFPHWREYFQ